MTGGGKSRGRGGSKSKLQPAKPPAGRGKGIQKVRKVGTVSKKNVQIIKQQIKVHVDKGCNVNIDVRVGSSGGGSKNTATPKRGSQTGVKRGAGQTSGRGRGKSTVSSSSTRRKVETPKQGKGKTLKKKADTNCHCHNNKKKALLATSSFLPVAIPVAVPVLPAVPIFSTDYLHMQSDSHFGQSNYGGSYFPGDVRRQNYRGPYCPGGASSYSAGYLQQRRQFFNNISQGFTL